MAPGIKRKSLILTVTLMFSLVACGSSDEFAFSFVSDFSVTPSNTSVGGQASLSVVFQSSDNSVLSSNKIATNTDLAILIPTGIDIIANTSELDNNSGDDFKARTPNSVIRCQNGSHSVYYKFSSEELSNFGQNQVRLKVTPTENRGIVTFKAEADTIISNPCNIITEQSGSLTINAN